MFFLLDRTGIRAQISGVAALRHSWQHQVYHIFILVFVLLLLGSIHWRVIHCCWCPCTCIRPNKAWLLQCFAIGWAVSSQPLLRYKFEMDAFILICLISCGNWRLFNFDSDNIISLRVSHVDGILLNEKYASWVHQPMIYDLIMNKNTSMPRGWELLLAWRNIDSTIIFS